MRIEIEDSDPQIPLPFCLALWLSFPFSQKAKAYFLEDAEHRGTKLKTKISHSTVTAMARIEVFPTSNRSTPTSSRGKT